MSMEFKVNGNKTTKTVTVSDKDAAVFKRYMGYDLNQTEVEGYLDGYFMSPDPDKDILFKDAIDKYTSEQLSGFLADIMLREMRDIYGYKE